MNIIRLLALASAGFFIAGTALAQQGGTVTQYAFAIGKGAGSTSYTSLLCGSAQLAVGQSAAAPICRTLTGDVTLTAAGVTAIGANKVLDTMLRQGVARSVIGVTGNAGANVADIQGATDQILRVNGAGTALAFGSIDLSKAAAVGSTILPLANGGTNAATAANARTNLGVAIGSNVQAWDADLDCLAALSGTGILRRTGAGTCSNGTAVALTEMAAQGAYTIVANNSGSSAAPTAMDITALTSKASPVSADIVLIQDSAASNAFKKTTVGALASGGSVASLNGQTGALVSYYPPQGRLTLTSATPVMSSSVAASATVYFTPYAGNMMPIYDGTNLVPTAFAEVSQATTDATKSPSAVAASKMYDIFCWVDSAVNRCTRGPAWTNDTTRGYTLTAATVGGISTGILLNTSAITNGPAASRGTWVGTIRSNASSTIDYTFGASASGGSAGFFGVWNAYNRTPQASTVTDSGASYPYGSNTVRQARASAGNQISFIAGAAGDAVTATINSQFFTAAVSGTFGAAGMGVNNTAAFTFSRSLCSAASAANALCNETPTAFFSAALGLTTVSRNEQGDGTNNSTNNGSTADYLSVVVWN